MIRRDLPGRQAGGVLAVPRDPSGDLPPVVGAAPSSPAEALALAVAWAGSNAGHGTERALVRVAFRAILGACPAVRRADVLARAFGVDVLGDHLAPVDDEVVLF